MSILRKKIFKYINWFDWVVLLSGLILLLGVFLLFYRKNEEVKISVKLTDTNPLYSWNYPSYSYSTNFKIGDSDRNALGETVAQIIKVDSFDVDEKRQALFLDLKVKATYDSRTKLYYFRGKPLVYGSEIDLKFQNSVFKGIVTKDPSTFSKSSKDSKFTTVKFIIRGVNEQETPIEPKVIESLTKGRKILDSNGNVLVEIVNSQISPALRIVVTDSGDVLQRFDPFYKDATLDLRIKVKKDADKLYIYDDIPLRVGLRLNLPFDRLIVNGTFIEISDAF